MASLELGQGMKGRWGKACTKEGRAMALHFFFQRGAELGLVHT